MKLLVQLSATCLLILAGHVKAQQSQEFGDYTVHYNALSTSLLTPQVAKSYGIQRSASRALINIAVLKRMEGGSDVPVTATIEANAKNLTGQRREIELREITDVEGAVYYIGEMRVRNLETFDYAVTVFPEGKSKPLEVSFRQQFYTEGPGTGD
jgi:hypothetical protein